MRRSASLTMVKKPVLDLNEYVSSVALNGLFLRIVQEEEKIRTDPLARTIALPRRFFGSSGRSRDRLCPAHARAR